MSVSFRHQPHVVAVLFFITAHALRDANDHQVSIGVGTQGQTWRHAPINEPDQNSTDANTTKDEKAALEAALQAQADALKAAGQAQAEALQAQADLAVLEEDGPTGDGAKVQAKRGQRKWRRAKNGTDSKSTGAALATLNKAADAKPEEVVPSDSANAKSTGAAQATLETSADAKLKDAAPESKPKEEDGDTKPTGEETDENTTEAVKDKKKAKGTKDKKNGTSPADWSLSMLADYAGDMYQNLWPYNPFRIMVGHPSQQWTNDTQCGEPAEFVQHVSNLTAGEIAMCNLRYIVIRRCELPNETCVTCTCEQNENPECRHIEKCYQDLPSIWFRYYVLFAFFIILGHLGTSPLFSRIYVRAMQGPRVERFIREFIGTVDNHPKRQGLRIYLLVVQIFASGLNVILFCLLGMFEGQRFPWKDNKLSTEESWNGWLQFVMNSQMLVNYYLTWTKFGFDWSAIVSANAVIDVMTVHQVLLNKAMYDPKPLYKGISLLDFDWDKDFLFLARPNQNWHWLRSYRCLSALLEIQDMGALRNFTPVAQQVMKSGLRLWALVTCFCGCMSLMEFLGHDFELNSNQGGFKNVGECQAEGNMAQNLACIPFLVGIYWVFTTISTVGYGDYVPKSAITYVFVICVIVLGVTFFSVESGTLIDVMELEHHGLGPAPVKGNHVVLTGGAMRDVDEDVLYAFFVQLFHGSLLEQGYVWPEVVIFGKVANPDDVNKFLEKRLTGEMRRNISFCNGDPLKPEGMQQAKIATASYVFILPSSQAEDWDAEDEFNTHVALSVKSLSRAAYVLVLFLPSSLRMAILSGVHPAQCCCMNRLRTAIVSQATRVRGWPQLLNLMTVCSTGSAEGGSVYCKEILLPDDYVKCCHNSAWGFALSKHAAGRTFRDLAMEMYEATGALPICAQVNGKVVAGPIDHLMDPNIIVYCISAAEPKLMNSAGRFLSQNVDWHTLYLETREEAAQTRPMTTEEVSRHAQAPPDFKMATLTSAEDMNKMLEKAKKIVAEDANFCVAVMPMCDDGKIWPLLTQFIDKFGVEGSDTDNPLKSMSVVALVSEVPPQDVTDYLRGVDEIVQVALVHGDWSKPDVLRTVGVERCKALVCFPIRSLRADSANDSKTLTLLRLLNRMRLRAACFIMVELTSGMSGAHMMPLPNKMLEHGQEYLQPPPGLTEEAFNPFCAAGSVWVPRSLMGTVARCYYTNGLLEVLQAVTFDGKKPEEVRVEQIQLPKQFFGQKYKELVLAGLFGSVGPASILVLGLLRETLYSEAALLNPPPESRLLESDLVIVLANGIWAHWAQEEGIRCLGGRDQRKLDDRKV